MSGRKLETCVSRNRKRHSATASGSQTSASRRLRRQTVGCLNYRHNQQTRFNRNILTFKPEMAARPFTFPLGEIERQRREDSRKSLPRFACPHRRKSRGWAQINTDGFVRHPFHPWLVPFGCQTSARDSVRQILTYAAISLPYLCVFLLGDLCDKISV